MSDLTVFSPDFKEFVELLNKNEVKYLITGGYAVSPYFCADKSNKNSRL
ncbi:MAG: hypothetical protein ABJM22_10960 [Balneola sp.]